MDAKDMTEDQLREIIAMWESRTGGNARMAATMYRDILLTKQGRTEEADAIWGAHSRPEPPR